MDRDRGERQWRDGPGTSMWPLAWDGLWARRVGPQGQKKEQGQRPGGSGLLHFALVFLKHLCISLCKEGMFHVVQEAPGGCGRALALLLGCHTGFGSESTTSSSHFYSAPCRLAEPRASPTTPLSPPYIVGSLEEPCSMQRSRNCRIENVSGDPSPRSQPTLALLCIGLSSGYVFPHTVVVLPRAVLYSLTRCMLSVCAIIMIPIPYPWAFTCFQFRAFLKSPAIFDLPN